MRVMINSNQNTLKKQFPQVYVDLLCGTSIVFNMQRGAYKLRIWKRKCYSAVERVISYTFHNRIILTYFGSGGPSDRGFMESLHSDLNTRKASFCKMWENLAPGVGPEEFPDS